MSCSSFSQAHAALLVDNGVAVPVSGPGPLLNIPFTVVEQKETGLRQRFILWTREANEIAADTGYHADVPLLHISAYLASVNSECATTRDFRTGFYQIPIPAEARHLFTFSDADGHFYQLVRLPMGHSCAPEIMHTLAATAAGDPLYVLPEYCVAPGVSVDIWIDNIRFTGEREVVQQESVRLDATATTTSITWKEADSNTTALHYTFLGTDFNHNTHTVSPSQRLLKKIDACKYCSSPTAGDLESLAGRLLHAGAIAGVAPGKFWFAIKFFRRLINKINYGGLLTSAVCRVPPSVRPLLSQWIHAVQKPRSFPVTVSLPSLTIFVDASKQGWGGVIVDDQSLEMVIVGASWSTTEAALHINVLESFALLRSLREVRP